MRKTIILILFSFLLFMVEFLFFNLFGQWIKPNLLILLIIFATLFWGIRFGLVAAVISGIIRDSFGTAFFGVHLMSFVSCAYVTIYLGRFIYRRGSDFRRSVLVGSIVGVNILIQFFLNLVFGVFDVGQTFKYILIPEVIATILVANWTFRFLRVCVLRLSV